MKRWVLNIEAILLLCFVIGMPFACKEKPSPGPDPEPTVVVEVPTVPPTQESICLRSVGSPGNPPVCEDGANNQVTCPTNTDMLPLCR